MHQVLNADDVVLAQSLQAAHMSQLQCLFQTSGREHYTNFCLHQLLLVTNAIGL